MLKLKADSSAERLITVEVVLAETPAVGNGKEMTAEKIAELEKAGKLISQSRYWVSLVENQASNLQFAERVPLVIGRVSGAGGRGTQESVAYENVGTKLQLVARAQGDSVVLQLELDQTRLIPAVAKPEGEAAESVARQHTATTAFHSTLTIPSGKTIVAGGREMLTDKGKVQTWLLISATADDAQRTASVDENAAAEPQLKIFRLFEANAGSMATMLQQVFAGQEVRIAVDERTNSVIARGDPKTLNLIYLILMGLDEKDLKKSEVKK